MQWLIDIIQEWVQAQGYLTAGFVDRGDPAVPDFVITDLIKDDAWHEKKLSTIVPAGAKAVALNVLVIANAVTVKFEVRKKGNTNVTNISQMWPQVAFETVTADMIVACSEDRKIEYRADAIVWLSMDITVKGWWF